MCNSSENSKLNIIFTTKFILFIESTVQILKNLFFVKVHYMFENFLIVCKRIKPDNSNNILELLLN